MVFKPTYTVWGYHFVGVESHPIAPWGNWKEDPPGLGDLEPGAEGLADADADTERKAEGRHWLGSHSCDWLDLGNKSRHSN